MHAPLHAENRLPTVRCSKRRVRGRCRLSPLTLLCGKMYKPNIGSLRNLVPTLFGWDFGKTEESLREDDICHFSFSNVIFFMTFSRDYEFCHIIYLANLQSANNSSFKQNCLFYRFYSKNNPRIPFLIPRSAKSFSVEGK